MILTDKVDDVGAPAENLQMFEYGFFGYYSGLGCTYASQYDSKVIPLIHQSVNPSRKPAQVRHLTQKPALDIHLDSNRSVTATVGRISNGTDAPMTSPFRVCKSSVGDRVAGGVDIVRYLKNVSASERKSSQA